MDTEAGVDSTDDIQAKIFQTTLDEVKTSRQSASDSDNPDAAAAECCVICLDSISDPCAALPCSHAHFDFLCLLSWLEQHPNCPLCKANVYKVRYADAQNGENIYRVPNATRSRDTPGTDERAVGRNQSYIDPLSVRRFTSHRDVLRRHARQRGPPPTESEAIQRRRHIYRHELYSLHIGSNRFSRYRPAPTPTQFSSTPHLQTRARLWLRRELQVFSFVSSDSSLPPTSPTHASNPTSTSSSANTTTAATRRTNNAEFLLEYIVAILKTVDIQGSAGAGHAEGLLADFLGRKHARLFLHELRCWLRSPAQGLAAWDREVQYPDVSDGRRSIDDREGGHDEEKDEEEEGGEEGRDGESGRGRDRERDRGKGMSWRDRDGGDHWRRGGERKRRREGREGDEGRWRSRPKRERERDVN